MSEFDPAKPVFVKKMIPYGKGNIIPADTDRPILLETIPEKYRTKDYLNQPVGKKFLQPTSKPDAIEVIPVESTTMTPPKIQINYAPSAELQTLKWVGETVAKKIIDERNKKKFADLADLKARISLPLSGNWDENAEKLNFE